MFGCGHGIAEELSHHSPAPAPEEYEEYISGWLDCQPAVSAEYCGQGAAGGILAGAVPRPAGPGGLFSNGLGV